MKDEREVFEMSRLLIGEVPPEFYVEVVLRLFFIFTLALISLRCMGKRMAARLSRNELAALVSMAAAIGIPIQAPDKGLLPAVVIAIVIILLQRITSYFSYRSATFEKYALGSISTLVNDSVINLKALNKNKLSRERVFAQLRSNGIKHLGEVKRFYIEANGTFSLVKNEHPTDGLSIIPEFDHELIREQYLSEMKVCKNCGAGIHDHQLVPFCVRCGCSEITHAQAGSDKS